MTRSAIAVATALSTVSSTATGDPSDAVVFYLVSAGADSAAEPSPFFPWDERLGAKPPPHPWHWRVFDPRRGLDTLFLALDHFPTHAHWDSAFTVMEYVAGDHLERVPWRFGARPAATVTPRDSLLCDFRTDVEGRWQVVTQRDVVLSGEPGVPMVQKFVTRWDQRPDGAWLAAQVDSSIDDGSDFGCLESAALGRYGRRSPAIWMSALLDSMRIGNHRDSTLRGIAAGEEGNADRHVHVASHADPAVGLEMHAGFGDSDHAFGPVVWVDRRSGARKTVRASNQDASNQIAFAQRGGFVLVTEEYTGAFPVVADMRTGEVIFRVDRPSARAVWAPAPGR